jgi:hypothetical protein
MKKNLDQLFLLLVTLQKWFHGTERIPVENGLSRGRLELFAMWHEVALLWRAWDWSAWAWSTFIFLLLVGLNYVPRFGGVLWLGLAPILSGIMLLLALRSKEPWGKSPMGWLRWGLRCMVINYTVLAWFFFYLITGAAVSLIFAGALDWVLIRVPFKRAWTFSMLHLGWILPLFFFLGVIGKSIRFYLGAFFALPLVAILDGGILRSLYASRAACRKNLWHVSLWMFLGWLVSFLPVLLYLSGGAFLIHWMTDRLPGTFSSLWKIYGSCTIVLLLCFFLTLLAWPLGFIIQAAAFRRVWREKAQK